MTSARSRRGSLSNRGISSKSSLSLAICLYSADASTMVFLRQDLHGSEAGLVQNRHWNGEPRASPSVIDG